MTTKGKKTVIVQEPKKFDPEKPAGNNLVAEGIIEAAQEAAQELGVGAEPEKHYQCTTEAFYRAVNSYYPDELRKHFEGQASVSLADIEWQILAFQKRDGKLKDIEADIGRLPVGSLVSCELGIARHCPKQILPKSWVSKNSGKPTGNYTPDLGDSVVAVCHLCQELVVEDIKSFNDKVAKTEQKFFPRFLPRADAEDALARRQYAIRMKQEQEDKLGAIRGKLQARTTAQEIHELKRRYGR